jgi:hypothetical protein
MERLADFAHRLSAALALLGVLALTPTVLHGGTHPAEARALPMNIADAVVSGDDAAPGLGPRVRSSHAYLRAMIDEAALRSSTFRSIVAAIEKTNGIVYVEHGGCQHGVRTCLSLEVTPAAGYRILRILVDARQPDWDVMGSIGHELRHALEVLENPALVDSASVYLFYANGDAKDRPFETRAAINAGFAVRNEVGSFAKGRLH